MGAIPNDEIKKNKIHFVGINKDEGGFIYQDETYPGFAGILLGFGSHTYEFKGRTQIKFDLFLYDEVKYQIEFGKYSWLTFKLLNQLMNIPLDELKGSNNFVRLFLTKKDDNLNIFVEWNGRFLGWKYKFKDLKFDGKEGPAREAHRNKIIDKWADFLLEAKAFDPTTKIEAELEENYSDDLSEADFSNHNDEDLPF